MFSLMIQFQTTSDSPFNNTLQSFTKVLVMITEIEYDDMVKSKPEAEKNFFWKVVSSFTLVLFIIMIAIVLMNLMVGLAVHDIKLLEAHGRTRRLAKEV